MKKVSHSSVHLTMNIRYGSSIRVDALLSVNTGKGPERINLRETEQFVPSSEDGDASKIVVDKTRAVMKRVESELRKRGCEATADELVQMFQDYVTDTQSVEENLFGVIEWLAEIQLHFFTGLLYDKSDANIAGNSNPSHS